MSSTVIKVDNLSKLYRLGELHKQTNSFREKVTGMLTKKHWDNVDETIWALKDVSFEVNEGEVLGIIGRNGAGKSTLLKILSRITRPTQGKALINGRVDSLLEVGTGFHPELTGRENIFLNGVILGMRRKEIKNKFDDIVAFAEVEKFIDTPVKRYSSGMYVRLAFAVAAHLEPDILLVDEVLAVGDTVFQKKCLGKIQNISSKGRTVLFVSHNMAAISNICEKAILLKSGKLANYGNPSNVIDQYLYEDTLTIQDGYRFNEKALSTQSGAVRFTSVSIEPLGSTPRIHTGSGILIKIKYIADVVVKSPAFVVSVKTALGSELFRLSTMPISGFFLQDLDETGEIELEIPCLSLTAGTYLMGVGIARTNIEFVQWIDNVLEFDVEAYDVYQSGSSLDQSRGVLVVPHIWRYNGQEHKCLEL